MYAEGVRHLLLEGGPTVGAAFLKAGLVDELVWIGAPKLMGSGRRAIGDLGVTSVEDALELKVMETALLGEDLMIRCRRT